MRVWTGVAPLLFLFLLCASLLTESRGDRLSTGSGDGSKVGLVRRSINALEDCINAGMETFVKYCPRPIMALIATALFWPTIWWNLLLKKDKKKDGVARNWYDTVEKGIILGALPFQSIVPKLKAEGVTHVLNMVAEWGGPVKEYEKFGITLKRIPVIDFTPPSVDDIKQGANFIKEVVDGGGVVYVHCKAGRGRSASVVMGYLIQEKGMSPLEAQLLLNKKRPHVLQVLHERDVIKDFETLCKNNK